MYKKKPTILYTTPVIFFPPVSGPHLKIKNSIKSLSSVSNLYLYSRISRFDFGGENSFKYFKKYCKNIFFPPLSMFTPRNYVNAISRKLIKQNIYPPRSEANLIYNDILKKAEEIGADLIWLGYGNISYPLLKYIKTNSKFKVVVETDSIWSRYLSRRIKYLKDNKTKKSIQKEVDRKMREEIWGVKLADITTAVSETDAKYYRKLSNDGNKIKIFSNVIDQEDYKKSNFKKNIYKKPAIILIGTYWKSSPMEDGTRWFINSIWLRVTKNIPKAHLYILGNGSDKIFQDDADNNIHVLGQVASINPYLQNSDLMVIPLRYESGTRFKILEAGICGLPVISTNLGAEGLDIKDKENIIIANGPAEFTKSIIELTKNKSLAKKLSKNMENLIRKKYTLKNLEKEAEYIIKFLI